MQRLSKLGSRPPTFELPSLVYASKTQVAQGQQPVQAEGERRVGQPGHNTGCCGAT
jgi:hypothetical protein